MHELGILYHVAEQVIKVAGENNVTQVEAIVLQVGKLSAVIPRYLEACYPAAVDGTMLQNTRLEIETMPANGRCNSCTKVYDVVDFKQVCPHCGASDYELLCGKEFFIKEIRAC
ncbi:hydrogenase maturation nickel metallochaperone HypA [Eubacteriales bacterium OttesenSCG-928-K08]|nr:hydrogenase maturation nickel metallochaperone HypA [Eubacteriales bacterium OttesenSCG-928-K08]